MSISDEDFREAFKPLQIPSHYPKGGDDESKIIFALAQLEEGSANQVAARLAALDPAIDAEQYEIIAGQVLSNLFEKGLLNGSEHDGLMFYNLNKITEANDGKVDPDLLAPGLD